jgi:hypothetical protein
VLVRWGTWHRKLSKATHPRIHPMFIALPLYYGMFIKYRNHNHNHGEDEDDVIGDKLIIEIMTSKGIIYWDYNSRSGWKR